MLKRLARNADFKRFATGAVGVPVLVLCLVFGGWVLKTALFAVSVIGLREFYKALCGAVKPIHYAGYVCTAVYYAFIGEIGGLHAAAAPAAFLLATCAASVFMYKTVSIRDTAATFFGFFYVTLTLSAVWLTYEHGGGWLAAVAFVSAWGCDTGAYAVGRLLGKRKLTPVLSPNKTVEGAAGGTLVAGLLTAVIGLAIFGGARNALTFALIGVICAAFAQLGDLFASAVKRHTGIKDFGAVLPGHGGVIDRFDSVIFTAPAVYLMMLIFGF